MKKLLERSKLLCRSFVHLEIVVSIAGGCPSFRLATIAEAEKRDGHQEEEEDLDSLADLCHSILTMKAEISNGFLLSPTSTTSMFPRIGATQQEIEKWYQGVKRRTDSWMACWKRASHAFRPPGSNPNTRQHHELIDQLIVRGHILRDEVLHLAISYNMRRFYLSGLTSNHGLSRSLAIASSETLMQEGEATVRRLVRNYWSIHEPASSPSTYDETCETIYPRTWTWALDIMKLAVTAVHFHRLSLMAKVDGERPSATTNGGFSWEITTCVRLLGDKSLCFDTESLVEAIHSLV
jgi:hypothetical protein